MSVADICTKLTSNRTRVTVMPVGGHPGRSDASHRFGRSKEFLCRGHIAISRVSLSITSTARQCGQSPGTDSTIGH
jgi:hypothetical protein